jgi:hypothetical protein
MPGNPPTHAEDVPLVSRATTIAWRRDVVSRRHVEARPTRQSAIRSRRIEDAFGALKFADDLRRTRRQPLFLASRPLQSHDREDRTSLAEA